MAPLDQPTSSDTGEILTETATVLRGVSRKDAEAAVRTLLIWAGDDPNREGLVDTPSRVAKAYSEFFSGYETDPAAMLSRTFEEVHGYNDIVLLRDITFQSHCEHHVVPITGTAHVAYLPADRVVGISKLARVVDAYARRLQTQETMTAQIANCIDQALLPRGVAVIIKAQHQCMTTRGVNKPGVAMVTRTFTGAFDADPAIERRLMDLINT
jgi:GTP cyclohydrolase I